MHYFAYSFKIPDKRPITHPHRRGFINEPQRFQAGGACSLARARSPAPPALDYRTFPAKSFASTIGCGERTLRKEEPFTPAGLRQSASFASSRSPARRPASTTKKSSFRTERVFFAFLRENLPPPFSERVFSLRCLPAGSALPGTCTAFRALPERSASTPLRQSLQQCEVRQCREQRGFLQTI